MVVDVTAGFTIRINVATESQPDALSNVAVNVPAAESDCVFQLYGNWFAQIVVFVVDVTVGLTVRFNVAIESQPEALISVAVNVPAAESDCVFQL